MSDLPDCRICGSVPEAAGEKWSGFSKRLFALAACSDCGYSFVVEPREDFEALYDAAYYAGAGADPDVNYNWSVADPKSTQRHEWRGVLEIVRSLTDLGPTKRWLDFGCGLGGLVRYARAQGLDVVGHDEGYSAGRMRLDKVPFLTTDDLPAHNEEFDVVTAIEVLEHTANPLGMLSQISRMLKPGGLLFLTTGNAEPYRGRLPEWRYVNPDVHVSFFEPRTIDRAFRSVGLVPAYPGFTSGFASLIRAKVLRTIGAKRSSPVELMVPWRLAARVVDRRFSVSAHPVAWKPVSGSDHDV